ncbi:hypothetical protein C0993_004094 [Termitomyces sp. T159_Od127]|nr:hypothetical protein C0993_004094 [Termitomyces sp. T159_Od127]
MPNLLLPLQEYPETYYLSQLKPLAMPPIDTPPSPFSHQQVEAYNQQHDEVLCSLCISLAEFAKCTHTLLISLKHHNLSETLKQWANHLHKLYKLYQCGAISESAQNILQVDLNLWDKLHALVDVIHTSPHPQCFENPMDPTCSFQMQHEEPIKPQNPVPAPVLCQQEELNVALNISKDLNPTTGGLFDPSTACTIGLLACSHANSLPSPAPSAPGDSPLKTTPILTLLSTPHLLTTTTPPPTPSPTSANSKPLVVDQPLLAGPLP